VLCRQPIFLEVHHIEPEAEGGSCDIENAAPLCPTCHDLWGSHPEKRKYLREVRDFCWEYSAKIEQHPSLIATNERIDELQQELRAVSQGQTRQMEIMTEIKALYVDQLKSTAGSVSSARTVEELMIASGSAVATPGTGSLIFTGHAPTVSVTHECSQCGFHYDMDQNAKCPKCGYWIGGPGRSA
jgi:5-methylcytosine-specific restriction endonuclease McrA